MFRYATRLSAPPAFSWRGLELYPRAASGAGEGIELEPPPYGDLTPQAQRVDRRIRCPSRHPSKGSARPVPRGLVARLLGACGSPPATL
jgi:hypothetical protein